MVWLLLRPFWASVALIFGLILLSVAASLCMPLINRQIIDQAILGRDAGLLVRYIGVYLAMIVGISLANLVRVRITTSFNNRFFHASRLLLFHHILNAPLTGQAGFSDGDLMNILMEDVKAVRGVVSELIFPLLTETATALLALAAIHHLSPPAALFCLGFIPVYLLAAKLANRPMRRWSERLREHLGEFFSLAMDAIRGRTTVKCLGAHDYCQGRFAGVSREVSRGRMRLAMLGAFNHQATHFLVLAGSLVIWYMGGRMVIAEVFTLGTLVALTDYFMRFMSPLNSLAEANIAFRANQASLAKIAALLAIPPESATPAPPDLAMYQNASRELIPGLGGLEGQAPPGPIRSIELRSVRLAYDGGEGPVLEGLCWRLERGQKVALVGKSGQGKSSLARLLVGLARPDGGSILINGRDLAEHDLTALRRRVGYVAQTPFIFADLLLENLRLGFPASREEVLTLVRLLHLEAMVASREAGLDQAVDPESVSGGEAQKISLVRGLLRDCEVYVFDESFSNMDKAAAGRIMDSLLSLPGKTMVFITHDLGVLEKMDACYILENRRLRPIGAAEARRVCGEVDAAKANNTVGPGKAHPA